MFQKGHVGGRPKGSRNKIDTHFRDVLETKGFNIVEELWHRYLDTDNEVLKVKILEIMCSYSFPKPKSPEELTHTQFIELLKVKLEEVEGNGTTGRLLTPSKSERDISGK